MNNKTIIKPFESKLHQKEVIDLWKTVFGYSDARNEPSLAIKKKEERNESVLNFYENIGYSVEKRVSMGKQISSNIPSANKV